MHDSGAARQAMVEETVRFRSSRFLGGNGPPVKPGTAGTTNKQDFFHDYTSKPSSERHKFESGLVSD
jgi:hypothetical protein